MLGAVEAMPFPKQNVLCPFFLCIPNITTCLCMGALKGSKNLNMFPERMHKGLWTKKWEQKMNFLIIYFVASRAVTHWEPWALSHTDWANRKCHLCKAHTVPASPPATGPNPYSFSHVKPWAGEGNGVFGKGDRHSRWLKHVWKCCSFTGLVLSVLIFWTTNVQYKPECADSRAWLPISCRNLVLSPNWKTWQFIKNGIH